jgi:hypothetical protein
MTIRIVAHGIPQDTAEAAYQNAVDYLRQSDLAKFLIGELEGISEVLTINVYANNSASDAWNPPAGTATTEAGSITWNLTTHVQTIEVKSDNPALSGLTKFISYFKPNVVRSMSPALVLMHEMGHACQFMTDKAHFRSRMSNLTNAVRLDIENINVNAIENTVANELNDKGFKEGIRWDYLKTKSGHG